MIILGIHIIVKKHEYAPEVFKKFLSKLINSFLYKFQIVKIIKNFSVYIFSYISYFLKMLLFFLENFIAYLGDFL